eukprot:GHVS01107124.1.p1 GENE.GHVS01107124.1~~GHVS01107124.1.p1  ORF type:complete len:256 (+),score=33.34 GHVS01107124.1:150-917(+)
MALVSPVRPSPLVVEFQQTVKTCCFNQDNRGRVWGLVCVLLLGQFTIPLNAQPTKLTPLTSSSPSSSSSSPSSSFYDSSASSSFLANRRFPLYSFPSHSSVPSNRSLPSLSSTFASPRSLTQPTTDVAINPLSLDITFRSLSPLFAAIFADGVFNCCDRQFRNKVFLFTLAVVMATAIDLVVLVFPLKNDLIRFRSLVLSGAIHVLLISASVGMLTMCIGILVGLVFTSVTYRGKSPRWRKKRREHLGQAPPKGK